jgi:phosphoribosylformylglycinamidine synthase
MGAKGDLGVELDLDSLPCREPNMSAYEMLLSESQERMLMVLDPAKKEQAEAIFRKWGLDFAIIGKTTDTLRFVVKHRGEIKADLPIKELGDEAPLYDRPHIAPKTLPRIEASDIVPPIGNEEALKRLLATPDLCAKRWIWEQYDQFILSNTVAGPGGDAAVIRLGETPDDGSGAMASPGLAFTTDVTQRYCEADPYEGGKQAVAEAWRNLSAVGALPRAVTDNLNFGNPEKPEIMGQLVACLDGIGEACRALDFPIVSGNVSLYNESGGRDILPTPSIGGVGTLEDASRTQNIAFMRPNDSILLIGETQGWLGQSIYLREICGREEGAPPPVDLAAEKRNGDFVRGLIRNRALTAAHDISDGGFAVALAEMALAGNIGASVEIEPEIPAHAYFYGEDQARYIVTAAPDKAKAISLEAEQAGVACKIIGLTGGNALTIGSSTAILLDDLRWGHEAWLSDYMTHLHS